MKVAFKGLPSGRILNVNAPNLPSERLRGARVTRLGRRFYKDELVEVRDEEGRVGYDIYNNPPGHHEEEGTDFAAIENDVKIVNFAPLPEIPGESLIEIPYDVQVQGDYHEVGRFLASVVSFQRVVRPTVTELLQSEMGAVQGLTSAPPAPQPTEPGTAVEEAPPEYEVLATMRLATYVPTALRTEVSALPGEDPVATGAMEEVRDES